MINMLEVIRVYTARVAVFDPKYGTLPRDGTHVVYLIRLHQDLPYAIAVEGIDMEDVPQTTIVRYGAQIDNIRVAEAYFDGLQKTLDDRCLVYGTRRQDND